jgi:MFS family permease
MLLGGIGIYLLISAAIRLVQTPTGSGYGFGASVITAGLMLTPFSATGFIASRTIPPLVQRSRGNLLLPAACGLVLLCLVAFAFLHGSLWEVFAVMTVAGFGVGALYAATPGFIVRSASPGTTTSAMSFNLVLTTIGGAIGSALSALVLQAATAHGTSIPTSHGYAVAAFVGAGVLAVAVLLSYLLRPRSACVSGNEPALAGESPRRIERKSHEPACHAHAGRPAPPRAVHPAGRPRGAGGPARAAARDPLA